MNEVSEENVNVILVKLQHLEDMLDQVHTEVKRTNGRVTELEKKDAWWDGNSHAKKPIGMIVTTVFAYTVIGLISWYIIGHA